MNEVRKLPLWKSLAEQMIETGIECGQTFSNEFFEEGTGTKVGTVQFNKAVHLIRTKLEDLGLYLDGRNQKGKGFIILDLEQNVYVMRNRRAQANRITTRNITLLANTNTKLLSQEEKELIESELRKEQLRYFFMRKPVTIANGMRKPTSERTIAEHSVVTQSCA